MVVGFATVPLSGGASASKGFLIYYDILEWTTVYIIYDNIPWVAFGVTVALDSELGCRIRLEKVSGLWGLLFWGSSCTVAEAASISEVSCSLTKALRDCVLRLHPKSYTL